MPMGVAWTTRSAPLSSSGRPTRAIRGAKATAFHARVAVLFTMTISAAPASARASTAALAAPPAPITAQRWPRGSKPAPCLKSSSRPSPSQLSALMAPGSNTRVFAAPRRRTCRECRVARRAAASLWGIVTDRPRTPSAAAPATAPLERARRHLEGQVTPVETHCGIGGVMQPGRERMADRETDDSGDHCLGGGPEHIWPRSRCDLARAERRAAVFEVAHDSPLFWSSHDCNKMVAASASMPT